MATQRPSVDVITGTPKPISRHEFLSKSRPKSTAAPFLANKGQNNYWAEVICFIWKGGRIVRVHGLFVSDAEVEDVANVLRQQGEPVYDESVTTEVDNNGDDALSGADQAGDPEGSLYDRCHCCTRAKPQHPLFSVICGFNRRQPSLKKWKRMVSSAR